MRTKYNVCSMLDKAMQVLRLFTPERRELGVTEAATLLGKPKSTTSRLLGAMQSAGFVERSSDTGRFRVSMRLAAVGELAKQSTSLQRAARPALERLTAVTGETSNLVVLVDHQGVNIEAVESPRPVMHMGALGRRFPLHVSAGCKALLAWYPEAEVRAMLPASLERLTPATITDLETLLQELAEVRERGYAVNWREMETDLAAVGAPIRDHLGQVVAAVSISAPVWRVPREALPWLGQQVAAAGGDISAALGHARGRYSQP